MAGRIAVVNADNRFERWAERKEIHERQLPHRSVHVALLDSQQRLVIQQRHQDKDTWPSYWDISCCGHVEESDYSAGPDDNLEAVYLEVARRELEEELGVSTKLTFLAYFSPKKDQHYEHIHFFLGQHDGPYSIQEDELQAVKAVSVAELDEMKANGAKLTNMLIYLSQWLKDRDHWG